VIGAQTFDNRKFSKDVTDFNHAMNGQQRTASHTHLLTSLCIVPNMQLQFINPRQTALLNKRVGYNPASEGTGKPAWRLYRDGV